MPSGRAPFRKVGVESRRLRPAGSGDGVFRQVALVERAPHPDPLPASGEREKRGASPESGEGEKRGAHAASSGTEKGVAWREMGARLLRPLSLAIALVGALPLAPAAAADRVIVGTVGSASANLWPVFIGINKGLFAEQDIAIDLVYMQSSAAMIQQLTAGSLDVTISTGLVDPIRAIDKGAPIAIVRFETRSPPYALVAKPAIKTLPTSRAKSSRSAAPRTSPGIYVERMLAPSGIKPGEFDMVFAGATAARAAALASGAVDAAILLPPYNFQAEAQGTTNLALRSTSRRNAVLRHGGERSWANNHATILAPPARGASKTVAWFEDDGNRDRAVENDGDGVGPQARDEVEKAYDFYRRGKYLRVERKGFA